MEASQVSMNYTADPLIKLGLRPDYSEAFDEVNSAIAGIATTSSSFWDADNGGIRYQGHMATGNQAAVDTIGPTNSVLQDIFGGGTMSTIVGIEETMTGTPPIYSNALSIKLNSNYSSTATSIFAVEALAATSSGNTFGSLLLGGFFGGVSHRGTGSITNLYGVAGLSINAAAGTVTNCYGGYFQSQNGNAAGTVTNCFGIFVAAATNAGTVTNNYNIYSSGVASRNYFDGYVETSDAGGFYSGTTGSINNRFLLNAYLTADAAAEQINTPSSTARKALVLQMRSSQTANAMEVQDNSGNVVSSISPTGLGLFAGINITDASDIVVGTSTGTKIGTSTSQKIGFWNTTPVAQPTTGVGTATFTANAGTAVNDASTFDGYTLKQVVKALRNIGLLQ